MKPLKAALPWNEAGMEWPASSCAAGDDRSNGFEEGFLLKEEPPL